MAMKMYENPALEDFDYYWRLDSDSFLISRVFVDPIGSLSLAPHPLTPILSHFFLAWRGWRLLPWIGLRTLSVCVTLLVRAGEFVWDLETLQRFLVQKYCVSVYGSRSRDVDLASLASAN